jgi:hypothetical protein
VRTTAVVRLGAFKLRCDAVLLLVFVAALVVVDAQFAIKLGSLRRTGKGFAAVFAKRDGVISFIN